MPQPDVTIHLRLQGECPGQPELQAVRDGALGALPLGENALARAVCVPREQLGNVLLIGLWASPGNATDAQLHQDLITTSLLGPADWVGLQFTQVAIQTIASAEWAKLPKKHDTAVGFVRLGDELTVTLTTNKVITKFRAEWKSRFLPNVPFRVSITDLLGLAPITGSRPPITATTSRNISTNTIKWAVIATIISPVLGAAVFWKGDTVAEGLAPAKSSGIGGILAAQWPFEFLTSVSPPRLLGKILFFWTKLFVDANGITTTGIVAQQSRDPQASIIGPRFIETRLPTHTANVTYHLETGDMRGEVHTDWSVDGHRSGHGDTLEVHFRTPGVDPDIISNRLQVQATDVDGLVASAEMTVHFAATVPPGRQPN